MVGSTTWVQIPLCSYFYLLLSIQNNGVAGESLDCVQVLKLYFRGLQKLREIEVLEEQLLSNKKSFQAHTNLVRYFFQ